MSESGVEVEGHGLKDGERERERSWRFWKQQIVISAYTSACNQGLASQCLVIMHVVLCFI